MKIFAKMVVAALGVSGVTAMRVNLYAHWGDATFVLDTAQRCYTFEEQWTDIAYKASWKSLPDASSIVFYEHIECRGAYVTGTSAPSGGLSFNNDAGLDQAVSSVMVQQYTIYPMNGLVYAEHANPADIF